MRFHQKSKTYDHYAMPQKDMADWLLEWIDEKDIAQKSILELGAGTGLLTAGLLGKCAHVTATDIDSEMLQIGHAKCPDAHWRILNAWDIQDEFKHDCLASSALLQWAEEPAATLRQWLPFLSENGYLYASLFVEPSLHEVNALLPEEHRFRWLSSDAWRHCIEAAGWRILESDTKIKSYYYPTALEAMKSVHGIGGTGAPSLSLAAMRHLLSMYDSEYREDEGIPVTWGFMRVICKAL